MPCFNTQIISPGQFLIAVSLLDSKKVEQIDDQQLLEIDIKTPNYKALVDTGANGSCITEEVAKELDLKPISQNIMFTAGHPTECNVYDVCIGIPVDTPVVLPNNAPDQSKTQRVMRRDSLFSKSRVMGLPTNKGRNREYACLLGMDILSKMTFQYSQGILTLCY